MPLALRARIGFAVALLLRRWRWAVAQPRLWRWMEGQFARMAALGDQRAQGLYGHILLFRGVGLGAKEEGLRLLRLAARAGDAKAAYQVGVQCLEGSLSRAPDAHEAAIWLAQAAEAGHPLAASKLAELYRTGAAGLPADAEKAGRFAALAQRLGL